MGSRCQKQALSSKATHRRRQVLRFKNAEQLARAACWSSVFVALAVLGGTIDTKTLKWPGLHSEGNKSASFCRSQWVVLSHCTAPFASNIFKCPIFVGEDLKNFSLPIRGSRGGLHGSPAIGF